MANNFKIANTVKLNAELTNIANSIRTKTNTSGTLNFYNGDFRVKVDSILTPTDGSIPTVLHTKPTVTGVFNTTSGNVEMNAAHTQSAGYVATGNTLYGTGNVSVGIGTIATPSGTGTATISTGTFAYNTTAGNYGLTGSASITGDAYRNVTQAGYLPTSNTKGSVTGTASLSTNVPKTSVTTSVSGTIERTPVIAVQSVPSGVTNAASGAATTTAPTTGVYVAVKSPTNNAVATATVSSVTAGYSDGTNYGKTQGTKNAGAAASSMTYVPITQGTIATPSGSQVQSTPTFDFNTSTGIITANVAATSGTAYRNVTKAGWLPTSTTGGTFTMGASSNTYTVPAGSFDNANNISGAAYLETTGDYGFRTTVQIPQGYYPGGTYTKDFTTGIFPAPESKGTASRMLTGYSLYDEDGKLITGTMVNQGAQTFTLTNDSNSYTIPEGYHNGGGSVTVPRATWDPISINAVTFNASNNMIIINATVARSAGVISAGSTSISTPRNIYALVGTGASTISGTIYTGTPGLSVANSTGIVTAAVASANTSLTPSVTAGYITSGTAGNVTAKSNSNTLQLNTKAGGTTTITSNTKIINAGQFATGDIYATVTTGVINTPSGSATQSTPTFSFNALNGVVTASVAATSGTAYRNVTTAGYLPTSTTGGTFTMNASSNTYNVGLSTKSVSAGTASGATVSGWVNVTAGYTPEFNQQITASVDTATHPTPVKSAMTFSGSTVTYNIYHTQPAGYNAGHTSWLNGTYTVDMTLWSEGATAPSNTSLFWIDTDANTGGLKYYNGSAWTAVPVAWS